MAHQQHDRRLRRFEPLSRLDGHEIGRRQVDPRGWAVGGNDGRTVGKVHDLIVDTTRMVVQYLDIALDDSLLELPAGTRVLVPIRQAQRDGKLERLVVDGLNAGRVMELSDAYERSTAEFWDRAWGDGAVEGIDTRMSTTDDWAPRVTRRVSADELRDALHDADAAQEPVRIPVVKEELVVLPGTSADARPPVAATTRPDDDAPARPVDDVPAARVEHDTTHVENDEVTEWKR